MLLSKSLALVLPAVILSLRAAAQTAPTINLGYATYQGVPNAKGNIDFLGIRYAAPPVGNLRFRAPVAPATVAGVQIANTQPNMCPQGPLGLNAQNPYPAPLRRQLVIPPISEDCLFLNVVVPGNEIDVNADLPVVVWIHGGGYVSGSVSYPGFGPTVIYDGNDLVEISDSNAIVVMIQYRLGLHGFLASTALRQDGDLNAGLLDQEFALKWIQSHIGKFGGDPDRVTIWGESAGAGSVLQHLVAHEGNTNPPLFQNAILSSTYLPPQYWYHERIPEALYAEVLSQAGCTSAPDPLTCLRGVSSSVLDTINNAIGVNGFFGTFVFVPVVDGEFISNSPAHLIRTNQINSANVMAVTNTMEGLLFVNPEVVVNATDYISKLFPDFPANELVNAAAHYAGLPSAYEQAVAIMGETIFICPTYALLKSLSGEAYKGEYAVPPAGHGEDVAYYFPSSSVTGTPAFNNQQFITTFAGAFLDFAVTTNPNANRVGSVLPNWPKWSIASPQEMIFGSNANAPAIATQNSASTLVQRCAYWDLQSPFMGQ